MVIISDKLKSSYYPKCSEYIYKNVKKSKKVEMLSMSWSFHWFFTYKGLLAALIVSVIFGGIDTCWSSFTIGTFWTLDFWSWFSGFSMHFNFFFTIPQTSEFDFCECQLTVYFWFSQKSKKLSKLTQEKKRKLKYSSMKEIESIAYIPLKRALGLIDFIGEFYWCSVLQTNSFQEDRRKNMVLLILWS